MGMTITEKILARKSGQARVRPGELVTVSVDVVIFVDTNFNANRWREMNSVADPDKIIVVLDHRVPAATPRCAAMHRTARAFVKKFGIKRFHDVGYSQGISHQLVADHAYALPGDIVLCSDSHTGSGGVFNCLARGVGVPDVVYSAAHGETWFSVPETIRYNLTGRLPKAVTMKDAFLQIAGQHGEHTNLNVEYGGEGLRALDISARKTLTTMSTELSAEFAVCEADGVMIDWLKARTDKPFECVHPDADAKYADVRTVALDQLEPLVALPDGVVRNSQPVSQVAGTPIDQAFVGSCANGTLEDFALVASILRGKRVHDNVRFVVTPASQWVYREANKLGYIATITDAGAVVTAATCGACSGGHMGVLGAGETCITASTRNFKGRMGDPDAKIYMGSPATVAASAIKGVIADPREYLD